MSAVPPFSYWSDLEHRDKPRFRLTEAWFALINKDQCLRDVLMVVEYITGDGCRFRFATDAIDSVDNVKPVLFAEAGIANDYDLDTGNSSARSAEFEVPESFVDVKARIASGAPLAGFGEVSLIAPGMPWEERYVLIRGDVGAGVGFGAPPQSDPQQWTQHVNKVEGQTVQFSIEDPRASADVAFPPIITADSLGDGETSLGEAIPYVFGTTTVPAVLITTSTVAPVFAVGIGDLNVTKVTLNGDDVTANFAVGVSADADGRLVTTLTAIAGGPYPETGGSVVATVEEPSPLASEVIRDVLSFHPCTELLVNEALLNSAAADLGGLRLDGFINDRTSIFEWLEQGLTDDLQMLTFVWKNGRYGPVVTDFRKTPSMRLVKGGPLLFDRVGYAIESPKSDILNDVTVLAGYDAALDAHTIEVSANPDNSTLMAASAAHVGRLSDVFDGQYLGTLEAGSVLLDWIVQHRSAFTYLIQYTACPALFFSLCRGDVVTLYDDEMCWFDVTATVERLEYQRGFLTVSLRIWNNPIRGLPWPAEPA